MAWYNNPSEEESVEEKEEEVEVKEEEDKDHSKLVMEREGK